MCGAVSASAGFGGFGVDFNALLIAKGCEGTLGVGGMGMEVVGDSDYVDVGVGGWVVVV